jgi:hypothetical protein
MERERQEKKFWVHNWLSPKAEVAESSMGGRRICKRKV